MAISHDLSKGRILVTGGAGFIGSALIWELNRRGLENIVACDFLGQDEKWRNLTPLRFMDYVEADELADRVEDDCPTLASIKTVFHLGACSSTTETNAAYLIDNNYNYTKLLAGWALRRSLRFVYASSAATYGDGAHGMDDKDEAGLPALRPLNMYGYSKQLFDLYSLRQKMLHRITGLKYFNVFGPNESHKGEMRSLVHKAYGQIFETGRVQLFKSYQPEYRDGEQKRDFLYVKDAVAMTLALAENPAATGLFNVGSGVASTWLQLTDAIFKAMGKPSKVEFIEMPEVLRGKYQYFTQADVAKLRAAAPSLPKPAPLADCVADYVTNYLASGQYLGDEIAAN